MSRPSRRSGNVVRHLSDASLEETLFRFWRALDGSPWRISATVDSRVGHGAHGMPVTIVALRPAEARNEDERALTWSMLLPSEVAVYEDRGRAVLAYDEPAAEPDEDPSLATLREALRELVLHAAGAAPRSARARSA